MIFSLQSVICYPLERFEFVLWGLGGPVAYTLNKHVLSTQMSYIADSLRVLILVILSVEIFICSSNKSSTLQNHKLGFVYWRILDLLSIFKSPFIKTERPWTETWRLMNTSCSGYFNRLPSSVISQSWRCSSTPSLQRYFALAPSNMLASSGGYWRWGKFCEIFCTCCLVPFLSRRKTQRQCQVLCKLKEYIHGERGEKRKWMIRWLNGDGTACGCLSLEPITHRPLVEKDR